MKKGQFNFVWIFAILAGGTILVLAIWGAVQTGDTLRYGSDTAAAKSVAILTDPLQAGFAEGSFGKIMFRQETRINNICLSDGSFGKNDISVATRSGVGAEWNFAGGASSVHNKYIFSKEKNEGLDFYVFSKPFEFPYEVSDLIFMSSGRYCFVNAPKFVEEEVSGLGIENIAFFPKASNGMASGEPDNCGTEDERVCFGGGSDCDMIVYGSCMESCDSIYDEGVVVKNYEELKYVGNLIWGAIFSDKLIYDCNVERLMFRVESIANIFAEKADLMDARGCGTNLKGDLTVWGGMVNGATSDELMSLAGYAEDLGKKNDRELCGMW